MSAETTQHSSFPQVIRWALGMDSNEWGRYSNTRTADWMSSVEPSKLARVFDWRIDHERGDEKHNWLER